MKRSLLVTVCALAGVLASPARAGASTREDVTLTTPAGLRFALAVVRPDAWTPESRLPVIFALPPGNGDINMVNAFLRNYWLEEADRRGYIIVSPAVLGSRLESTAGGVVDTVLAWLEDNEGGHDPARIALAGQSNGGRGAFHVVRARAGRFASVVVMPGGYSGAGSLEMLSGKPFLLTVGERDGAWVDLTRGTRDRLRAAGARVRVEVIPGAGHVFPYPPERLFDWIEQTFP